MKLLSLFHCDAEIISSTHAKIKKPNFFYTLHAVISSLFILSTSAFMILLPLLLYNKFAFYFLK